MVFNSLTTVKNFQFLIVFFLNIYDGNRDCFNGLSYLLFWKIVLLANAICTLFLQFQISLNFPVTKLSFWLKRFSSHGTKMIKKLPGVLSNELQIKSYFIGAEVKIITQFTRYRVKEKCHVNVTWQINFQIQFSVGSYGVSKFRVRENVERRFPEHEEEALCISFVRHTYSLNGSNTSHSLVENSGILAFRE